MHNINNKNETNFLDFIYILLRRRKIIITSFLIFSILAVIISLIIPVTYNANAVIRPAGKDEGLMSNFSLSTSLGGFSSIFGGGSEDAYNLISILKSRTIAENTIKHFGLIEKYDIEYMEDAVKFFNNNLNISLEEEGTIIISMTASTGFFHYDEEEKEARQLSADMVNYLVQELNRINTELKTKQAKSFRLFIEKRYNENKKDLKFIEDKLKKFSETYGMISLPDQISAAITVAANLEGEMLIKEVEFEALKNTFDLNHPEIRKRKIELSELRSKLLDMKYRTSNDNKITIFPLFSEVPELGAKYVEFKRENEVQNQIYQFLTQQYEQAKLQEAKDTPTIKIIDEAVPYVRKAKPVRSLICIVSGFLGFFVGIFIAFLKEYLYRISLDDPNRYNNLVSVFKETRKDLFDRKSGKI